MGEITDRFQRFACHVFHVGHTVSHMEHTRTPAETSAEVSRRVASALAAAGISQRAASEQTGIPLSTLSRRLAGASPLTVTELACLADLLGTTIPTLTGDCDSHLGVVA